MATGERVGRLQRADWPGPSDVQRTRLKPLYVKLRPGPNGHDHDAVASNQRSRLIGAMIEEVAKRGYAGATLARLVALAGVSKRAFHEQFGTKQAYFLATYDAIVGNAVRRIGVAYRSEGDWPARLRAAFDAYASEVVEKPNAARLVLVETLGVGPSGVARMQRTRLIFEQMMSASFSEAPGGMTLPPLIAKGIVCGVERITRQRLLAGEVAELPALADELLAWVLAYRSPAAAGLGAGLPAALPTRCGWRAPHVPRARGGSDWVRILRCAAEIAATKGYAQLSPARIARDAGVTEARFDELFESTEQCFLDALDRLGLEALVCAARASQGSEEPLTGMYGAIVALMRHIATSPVLVRIAFVEISALGPAGIERRERLLGRFTDQLMRGLPQSRASSRLAAEASIGAVWGILHHHVTRGATHLLPELADYATYIALAPVTGGEAAVQVIMAARKSPDLYGHPGTLGPCTPLR
jgi:AcrR family transcriptional regulator